MFSSGVTDPAAALLNSLKYADDTVCKDVISSDDEAAYRSEILQLLTWYRNHHLIMNAKKTKEIVINFKRNAASCTTVKLNEEEV